MSNEEKWQALKHINDLEEQMWDEYYTTENVEILSDISKCSRDRSELLGLEFSDKSSEHLREELLAKLDKLKNDN